MEEKLKLRKEQKSKKPNFLRQDAHVKAKLANKWRQPKGLHSKLRRKLNSKRKQPSTGYSSPRSVRGLHKLGLKEHRIASLKDFEGFDTKTEGVLLGSVGKKKKVELLKKALALKLTILNVKDPQTFIALIEEEVKAKKEKAKSREEKKKKSKSESLKKAEEKKKEKESKGETSEESLEEKAKKEKEEKKKVLEGKNEAY